VVRLDHLSIPVSDCERSREWYVHNLGLQVEFEIPERKTVAVCDEADLTLFLYVPDEGEVSASCTLTFQVDDVHETYRELSARGVPFEKDPQILFWGYGAELHDPDGYLIYLWDEKSMEENTKGGT
jgi:catechol 2,3-dioxygenase-like lactoylglutathione lyase family enzyme